MSWANASAEDPIPRYLVGYQLWNLGEWELAIPYLEGDVLPEPSLDSQRQLALASSLMHVNELDRAEEIYKHLRSDPSRRVAALAEEGLDRVGWLR
jgi:hypothetical protein